jgi:hypothetical protein
MVTSMPLVDRYIAQVGGLGLARDQELITQTDLPQTAPPVPDQITAPGIAVAPSQPVLAACSENAEWARAASLKNSVNGPPVDRKRAMERAVLTLHCARAKRPARSAAPITAALALAVLFWGVDVAAAQTAVIVNGGCIGARHSINCATRWGPAGDPYVRLVPQPLDAAAIARAKERDRRWVDRCRPVVAPDRYGVPRYHYAQPGCEFGVGAN